MPEPGWYCGKFGCPVEHPTRTERCDPDSDYWDDDGTNYSAVYNQVTGQWDPA